MHKSKKTEKDFIVGLKKNDNFSLRFLYKLHFPMILNFVLSNNGSEQEAKDVYQEAFIVFYNNIHNTKFKLECKIKTYIYSVSRRLWLNELKFKKKTVSNINDVEEFLIFNKEDEDKLQEDEKKFEIIDDSFKKLGEPCTTILKDFYIHSLSIPEIVEKMGYTNTDNAKNQKYKCLKRLKKIFFSNYK
ncbi:MAG: sigma-70 family RNA polymerase sigma factor [Bacteroidota bacterium]|nr:sigma-70 family RNA polymerase sigma factor [Bacteroidota bacterium]